MTAERIDYTTGEVVATMTEPEARRATERIRTALDRVSTAWQDLAERVADAYSRRADLALGYGSWAEYTQAEFNVPTLATEVRRELVSLLSAQGMSTRAIAPVVGVTQQAVSKSLHQVTTALSPEPQDQEPAWPPVVIQAMNAWLDDRTVTKFQLPRGAKWTDETFPRLRRIA